MKRPLIQSNVPGEASGFVLVGVVMIALALTILGLSLFSLSGYESQFLDRSSGGVVVTARFGVVLFFCGRR